MRPFVTPPYDFREKGHNTLTTLYHNTLSVSNKRIYYF